ncbi:hypothetical protein QYE76_039981 [Lolium multiflorum]|uniref:Reverse transcriptase domain-containing protein n=1 Tax=Lolium multiflorum TaxID=4521 RepID=A0AAD8TCL5_LOLMU|nr:hypothetical protein QYE76_039981 [Lolium multiflorum]
MSVSLYADDVVIFCHPDETELRAIRGILELFGHASGLRTNFAKCSVSPIACSDEEATAAAGLMECQLAQFPVKYLGIPLSIRRLSAASFQPLVDRLADKLPTWRASLMPRAGRLALIRAVLAAIPLHQLMVLGLDKKTLKQVNKILRGFLWAGRADANGGNCHVNWSRVCRPLRLGGLGIPDLARTAISLRVRWIWRMRTDPMRPWHGLNMQFSKVELDVFAASTSMEVGNGESALFWEDKWLDGRSVKEMAPEVYALVPKRRKKARTVREALIERAWVPDIAGAPSALALWQYVQLWCRLRDMQLSTDRIGWLACLDRCWTGERLARTIWFEVLSWIRSTSGPPTVEGDFAEWWSLVVRTAPRQLRKGIVLGPKISEKGIEVDRAKVEAIEKMPYPRDVKDRKGADNPVADNLSRLENIAYDPVPVNDSFPNEQLAVIKMSSQGSSSEDYATRRKRELLQDLDQGTFVGWAEEERVVTRRKEMDEGVNEEVKKISSGPLPPAPDLNSFPAMEETLRVTDEFCDQYRVLRREVEIFQKSAGNSLLEGEIVAIVTVIELDFIGIIIIIIISTIDNVISTLHLVSAVTSRVES